MSDKPWQKIDANSSGYTIDLEKNDDTVVNPKLIVGTATTGMVRVEWIQARYGLVFPTNWGWVQLWQYTGVQGLYPLGYQVDDAQNLIVMKAMEQDYDWVLLYEHDMLPQPDAMLRFAEYMKTELVPVVSGFYFTRSMPSEPLIYRGRGTLAYEDFDIGDRVWCDGVPTGMLLIHTSILKAMWEDCEEYQVGSTTLRRIFNTPKKAWFDPETGGYNTVSGTSDLDWCKRVMEGRYFEKAGWPEYQKKEFPFLVDTNIACDHINNDLEGKRFPPGGVYKYWTSVREARRKAKEAIHENGNERS